MSEGLTRLLDKLVDGFELQDVEFGALSDLDRSDAAVVRARWPDLETAMRAMLLERAGELADVNLELDFHALGRLALDDPDPEVRERAVSMLWESDDPQVGERLAALATHDPGPGVRAAAALALESFVEQLVLGRLEKRVSAAVVEALRVATTDADAGVRAAAIEALGALDAEWVGDRILEAYESDDRQLQVAAIRAMGASALERWSEYIADQLYSGETEMRFEAVLAAGALGSDSLVAPLGELLTDDDPEIVLAGIAALGEIGGEEAVELLREFAPHVPEGGEDVFEEALSLAGDTAMFRQFGAVGADQDPPGDDD